MEAGWRVSFFVASNAAGTLAGLPDGSYQFRCAFGNNPPQNCRSFISLIGAGQFRGIETL